MQDEEDDKSYARIKANFVNYAYGHNKLILACTIFTHYWKLACVNKDKNANVGILRASRTLEGALVKSGRLREVRWLKEYFVEREADLRADSVQAAVSASFMQSGQLEVARQEMAAIKDVRTRRHARTELIRARILKGEFSQAFADIPTISSINERLELLCSVVEASAKVQSPETEQYLSVAHDTARLLPIPTIDQMGDKAVQHPLEYFAYLYLLLGREEEYVALVSKEEPLLRDHLLERALGDWMFRDEFDARFDFADRVLQLIENPLLRMNAIVFFLMQLRDEQPREALKYLAQMELILKTPQGDGEWFDQDLHDLNESYYAENKEYLASLLDGREATSAEMKDPAMIVDAFLERGDFLYALRIARQNPSPSVYRSIAFAYIRNKQLDAALNLCREIQDPLRRFTTLSHIILWLCWLDDAGRYEIIMPFVKLIEKEEVQITEEFIRLSITLWAVLGSHVVTRAQEKLKDIDRSKLVEFFDGALRDEGGHMLAGILLTCSDAERDELIETRVPLDKRKRVLEILEIVNINPFANRM
jgi:hypothetical protein